MGVVILIVAAVQEPSLENFTLLVSILLSGLYTGLLFLTRDYWLKKLTGSPLVNAILLGSINAAIIETIFLFVEKAFGASGVAAWVTNPKAPIPFAWLPIPGQQNSLEEYPDLPHT